eukprot:CAMPEP_0182917802 /NCGR_PEP_ID=MMETSP0105_2-20130417/1715_1 /TAXON_ID=81532 ORGANISM="Acanthoeca-like sp., Strain 10tr" /NCGR_SAMPLE_ID=MMETSP0105_2 /ASSEMBLY_ACC=CAM_ASM_000205 /LENGTH=489 /DNA_ID=CAMNT_0025054821 /DNA_START=14 /DNA_END=1483 /DNA_ORIENTATION=+
MSRRLAVSMGSVLSTVLLSVAFSAPVVNRDGSTAEKDLPSCLKHMLGDGECQFVCNNEAHNFDGGDCTRHQDTAAHGSCDSRLGLGWLRKFRDTKRSLCTDGAAAADMYRVDAQNCGPGNNKADVVVLTDVQVSWDKSAQRFRIKTACKIDERSFEDYKGTPTSVNEGPFLLDGSTGPPPECTSWESDPAILVIDPRNEYLDNMYHASEEIFSLFETAQITGTPLEMSRLIFGSSGTGQYLQMHGQVENGAASLPPGFGSAREQIVDMFSVIVRRTRTNRLPALPAPTDRPTCFRKLVLPMRACHGSIGPASWERTQFCPHGNAIAEGVSHAVRHAFGLTRSVSPEQLQVTVLTRSSATKRVLRNGDAVKRAIESALPGRKVELVTLDRMSFVSQMRLLHRTAVLVGPHGAGMSLLLFLPRGAGVVESTSHPPPWGSQRSVAHIFWQYAMWTNHPYGHVSPAETPAPGVVAGKVREMFTRAEEAARAVQ